MDFKRVNLLFCLELDKTSGDGPEGKKLADDKRKALAKCHKDVLSPRDCSELEEGFDILHPESYLGRRNGHGSVMDLITRIHKEEILRDGLSILIAFQLHEKNIGPKRDVDALKELGITQEFINVRFFAF